MVQTSGVSAVAIVATCVRIPLGRPRQRLYTAGGVSCSGLRRQRLPSGLGLIEMADNASYFVCSSLRGYRELL